MLEHERRRWKGKRSGEERLNLEPSGGRDLGFAGAYP